MYHSDFFLVTFSGLKRCLKEILKSQEEIKCTLRTHQTMLENIIAHVGSDSSLDHFSKPQGWPREMPLPDIDALEKFNTFLEKADNFNYAVSIRTKVSMAVV